MHCVKCSTNIPEGLHVCTHCGFKAGASADTLVLTPDGGSDGPQESLLDVVRRELARDYEVESELARGGMAVVFRASEIELSRKVALKVLPPELALSQSMANRFKREAKMAASLEHPNIIPVYRVGQAGRLFFITMKYIDGRPLSAMIERQGALPVAVVWHVLRGCASALAHAHENGIIHRDIKGANILIDVEGRVVVSDFGVARALEDASMTASGSVIGTPYFMSPEQCAGKKVGPQSDQYSLGVLGFQMMTGQIPFDAETIAAVMHHHFFTPIPPLGMARPDAPTALVDVVNRALSKNPKQRFGTTAEMVEAIEAVPLSDADRRYGEAMLRELASGVAIPRISTGELPPLPEAVHLSGPVPVQMPGFTPSEELATGGRSSDDSSLSPADHRRQRFVRRLTLTAAVAGGMVMTGTVAAGAVWLSGSRADMGGSAVELPELPTDSAAMLALGDAGGSGPPAAAPESIAPAVPRGRVVFEGLPPQATLALNGQRLTRTRADFAPGSYRWEATAPGYFPAAGVVTIEDRDTTVQSISLRPMPPGKIRIRAYPSDAQIVVDGQVLGQGAVFDAEITAGEHQLRVAAPGFATFDTTFTVESEAVTQLPPINLKPPTP